MEPKDYIGKRYKDGDGYMVVTGVITSPAITMRNPVTGKEETLPVDSLLFKELEEVSAEDAARMLEQYVKAEVLTDPERARKLRHAYQRGLTPGHIVRVTW